MYPKTTGVFDAFSLQSLEVTGGPAHNLAFYLDWRSRTLKAIKKDGAFITRMVLWGYVYAMFTGFVVGWNVARLETLDLDGFSHFVQWFSHYKLQLRRKKKTGYSHQTPWVLTKICAYECKASMMYCVLILNFLILLVFFWRLIKLITWLWLATRLPPITSHHNY